VFRTLGLRSLPAQSAVKGMSSHAAGLSCLHTHFLLDHFFPAEISMTSSGQRPVDEKLQLKPVVGLRVEDLRR
jgi:hypothetical protein